MRHLYINILIIFGLCVVMLISSRLIAAEHLRIDTISIVTQKSILHERDTTHQSGLPKEFEVIKEHSSKNRWTKRIFRLLFRELKPKKDKNINESRNIIKDFKPYEGKIIRNINITVLPPFGTDINYPERESDKLKFFNNIHALTRKSTIRNIIQFQKGKPLNAAITATSEAELRKAGYIYDARIMPNPIEYTQDSIDVNIVVRDKWTIGVNLRSLSPQKTNIDIFDRNILGSGSRVNLDFIYSNRYDRKVGIGGKYTYENIAHKNINLAGSYIDRIKEYELSFAAIRPLQIKLKNFGELSYLRNTLRPDRINWDSITPDINQQFSVTIGKAFTLSQDHAIQRVALSLRYKLKHPQYKTPEYENHIKDVLKPYKYTKNQILLMQLSIFKNSYLREYMIYNFGNTEDIAQGYNISMQLGYSHFPDKINNAMYTSMSTSFGSNNIVKGNIYLDTAISSFFDSKKAFGGVFKIDARYFTPLFHFSDLRYRQFFSLSYSKLLHPDRYFGDRIYMGEHTSLKMRDWKNDEKGIEYLLFKSETDMFSNYEIAGFRFLFYSFFDMGWIKKSKQLFQNNNFNYGIGLGIRLRNNFIILNTINLKIGFYPKLDQNGFNSFYKISSSTPNMYPNFTPDIPNEILLE